MKKMSQQPTIDLKKMELQRVINDTLKALNLKMEQATKQLSGQITKELNTIVTNLNKEVTIRLNEIKGRTVIMTPQQIQQQVMQRADDGVPAFWRNNLDYGVANKK